MSTLGSRLKRLRERQNIKQVRAAQIFGIDNSQLSRYESDQSKPDVDMLKKMSAFYDVSVDYLMGTDNKEENRDLMDAVKKIEDLAKKYDLDLKDPRFIEILNKAFEISLIARSKNGD